MMRRPPKLHTPERHSSYKESNLLLRTSASAVLVDFVALLSTRGYTSRRYLLARIQFDPKVRCTCCIFTRKHHAR